LIKLINERIIEIRTEHKLGMMNKAIIEEEILQFSAAVGTIAEFCRDFGFTIYAIPERQVYLAQIFPVDFSARIFLKFPADKRIQLIKAATAWSFYKIPYIPPEKRYEKYMEIPVHLVDFIHGQPSA
jgi:hypothetical protein